MKKNKKRQVKQSNDNLIYLNYNITFDAVENKSLRELPTKIRDRIEYLHNMVSSDPNKVIPELVSLIEKYPNVPILYNYLSGAYTNIRDYEKADTVVLENYKRHPDYVFAKINYAQICLEKGDTEKIPAIFNHEFDLKMLYPHRSTFHITELVGFANVMGLYFALKGDSKTAKLYYGILKKLAPRHPLTKQVKSVLYPPWHLRLLRKLRKRMLKTNSDS